MGGRAAVLTMLTQNPEGDLSLRRLAESGYSARLSVTAYIPVLPLYQRMNALRERAARGPHPQSHPAPSATATL